MFLLEANGLHGNISRELAVQSLAGPFGYQQLEGANMKAAWFLPALFLLGISPARAQGVIPKAWSFRNSYAEYEIQPDREVKHGGKASATIKSKTDSPIEPCFLAQMFRADDYRGKRLQFSAFIKSKDVERHAQMMLRIDGKEKMAIAFDNMNDRLIKGTNDWKEYQIVLDVAGDAEEIYLNFSYFGKGQLWIDDCKVSTVGKDVKVTREKGSGFNRTIELNKDLPKAPRNLDFEEWVPDPSAGQSGKSAAKDPEKSATIQRNTPPAKHLFFRCKLIINPGSNATLADAVIETKGGTILRVEKADGFTLPADANVVDCSSKFIIPGLIDTHGHLYTRTHIMSPKWQKTDARLPAFYLASGVTTIGDPGSMDGAADIALRNRIDGGDLPGPRYFLAGEYIEGQSGSIPWHRPIKTPEQARERVHYWAIRGAAAIKIYAATQGDVMQAAIDEAHEHSMRVWAHVGAVTFQQAIDMGVDQLFHGAIVMPDTRRPGITQANYEEYYKESANLDLDHPKVQAMFRAAARRKVVMTPTAVVMELSEAGSFSKHHMEEQKRFYAPAAWAELEKMDQGKTPSFVKADVTEGVIKKNKEFIRKAYDAGCLLSTGTDYVVLTMLPGWSLWREMEIFAEAGLPPMAVLKAATWNGAFAIGRSDQLGSVEPGKLADFVILDANPLDNISNVRKVHRVVKGGVVYEPDQLLKPMVGKVD
jgi:imidazolonepropionase-like amidohydrolase